jgi:DHA1 family inner membrane transport protein
MALLEYCSAIFPLRRISIRISLPILALAAASFGIGTTEFVIMGLLPDVARSLSVTIPQAGYLVSGYAMGVVIGAPLVAMATAGMPRKAALLALMALFTVGNLGCALAPDYWLLMAARIVTAFAHGAFFGIGAIVASNLVPREQRAQAVSMMFAGLTLANVLGVPFGTALGQAAGWRAAFFAVVVIGIIAFIAIVRFVPGGMPGTRGGLAREFRALGRWAVLLPMLISITAAISMFSLFTYITPLLEEVTGMTPHGVTGVLLMIGVGLTVGNLIGGRLADRNLLSTVIGAFTCVAIVLGALALVVDLAIPTLLLLMLWGGIAFALVSPLQIWVVDAATDAPNLASTLNQGAFNLGNAIGAWIGGVALNAGVHYAQLPLVAACVALVGLGLTLSSLLNRRILPAQVSPAE